MWTLMDSPVGELRLVEQGRGDHGDRVSAVPHPATAACAAPRDDANPLLAETVPASCGPTFDRELKEFDLPLAPAGSDFQRRVRDQALRRSATARPR